MSVRYLSFIIVFSFLAKFAFAGEEILKKTALGKDSGWNSWVDHKVSSIGGSVSFIQGKAVIKSPIYNNMQPYNIQLIKPLSLPKADIKYKLGFTASVTKPEELQVSYCLGYKIKARQKPGQKEPVEIVYCLGKPPFTKYASLTMNLQQGKKKYSGVLSINSNKIKDAGNPLHLRFFLGKVRGALINISDITLEKD